MLSTAIESERLLCFYLISNQSTRKMNISDARRICNDSDMSTFIVSKLVSQQNSYYLKSRFALRLTVEVEDGRSELNEAHSGTLHGVAA